jgi:hypothetical protein
MEAISDQNESALERGKNMLAKKNIKIKLELWSRDGEIED